MKTHEKAFMIIGTVAVMAASGIAGYTLFAAPDAASNSGSNIATTSQQSSSTAGTTSNATSTSSSNSAAVGSYKDGTYTGTASYMVPHGSNAISVTLTVKDGAIVSASAQHNYNDGESSRYVNSFDASLSSSVDGESLADISLHRIGGASLTTEAFSEVLDTIRSQASA